jgi:uncharacterized repeat protein (TIGR02543 family)
VWTIDNSHEIWLYPRWVANANSFLLQFDANGGTVSPANKEVITGTVVGELPTPTRADYTFTGWNTAQNGSETEYTAATVYTETVNTTLYAQWTSNASSFLLQFDANGGTVSPASKEVTTGAAVGVLPAPTRAGYVFTEWNTAQNGSGLVFLATTVYTPAANTTLYAQWEKTTGYADELQITTNLYPNPFAGTLHLTGAEGCILQVITTNGAVVHTQKVVNSDETISLDKLPAGLYFFRLEKDGKTKTVKAVKQP